MADVALQDLTPLTHVDGTLVITTSLTDKSSGDEKANVTSGTIQATYKPKNSRGNTSLEFQKDGSDETYHFVDYDLGLIGYGKEVVAVYDLCDGAVPRYEVQNGRDLNANSVVNYGSTNGPDKTATSKCSADETGFGGAIKVADVYDLIAAACAAQ